MSEGLKEEGSPITIGSSGADVRAAHEYLTKFGYFPNQSHAEHYPAWRPVVAKAPANVAAYDESSAQAVRAFQANIGLPATGIIDAATRAMMLLPRCGVPDGIGPLDASDKFATLGSSLNSRTFNWKVENGASTVTQNQATGAAVRDFNLWAQETGLSFPQLSGSGTAGIRIRFAPIDGRNNTLGATYSPENGSDMTLDSAENWSVQSPTPSGSIDLFFVILHELGHSLGLGHSGIGSAVMYPFYAAGKRTLDVDDQAGISLLYDRYTMLPGAATDVGVGRDGSVWVTSTSPGSDHIVYKWNASISTWEQTDAAAVRIAVDPAGKPWIINSAFNIYRRTTNSVSTGNWEQLPGFASDIGIGHDGTVWMIDASPTADRGIWKWNEATFSWEISDGQAARIAVGPTGVPWVVTSNGSIFRRSSSSVSSAFWEQLPNTATDIGIGAGGVAWKVVPNSGNTVNLSVWEEQSAVAGSNAPALRQWRSATNFTAGSSAVAVAVGPKARPYVINANGNIFTSTP